MIVKLIFHTYLDILVVLCALLMCGFPGLAMYSLLESEEVKKSSNFQQMFFNAIETMLPYTTPYVYPGKVKYCLIIYAVQNIS